MYVLSKLACVRWFEASQNVSQTKQLGKAGVKSRCGWFLCMVGYVGCFGYAIAASDFEYEKGIRWMPWHQEATKDVARCEKSWGAASKL